MIKILKAVFLSTIILFACRPSADLDRLIIGKWKMKQVFEYDVDVSVKHNPRNNRWIEFKADGTFNSGGDPFGPNDGKWIADNSNGHLTIDSKIDDDDSEWKVTFDGNQTIWTGIGHPRKENTRLVHIRVDP